jgi:ribosomal protein S14
MKKQIQKDLKIRKFFNKLELTSSILKNIIKNESFSLILKWNAILKLSSLSSRLNKTRFVNRCVVTRRKAKFNKAFKKFSRLSFLRLVRSGAIVGLKKSSW